MKEPIMNVEPSGRLGGSTSHSRVALFVLSILLFGPSAASAQVLGPFTVQLAPFCNVITFTAVPQGPIFSIAGFDDSCGGTRRSASGTLFTNPNSTLGGGLTIVSGGQVSSQVTLSIVTSPLSGTWSDNHGNSGSLVFSVLTGVGSPRPTADPQQSRVVRTCVNTGTTVSNTTTTTQTITSATIVAPGPGNIIAVYDGTFYKSAGVVGTAIQIQHGFGLGSTTIAPDTLRLSVYQQSTGTPFVDVRTEVGTGRFAVAAGTHTVNALVGLSSATGVASASSFGPQCLTLLYVERGGTGTIP